MFCTAPKLKKCVICKSWIDTKAQTVTVESHHMHKECFKCAICSIPLQQGYCATDHVITSHFGPKYFCPRHMMLAPGEKFKKLEEKCPVIQKKNVAKHTPSINLPPDPEDDPKHSSAQGGKFVAGEITVDDDEYYNETYLYPDD